VPKELGRKANRFAGGHWLRIAGSDLSFTQGSFVGYFIVEAVLFFLGLAALVIGEVPLARRRVVRGSAARLVGIILMIPLPLYLVACKQSHVSPFGAEAHSLDPLKHESEGFARLAGLMAAAGSALAATVLAIISSESRRR
jgi:hypothetical protein